MSTLKLISGENAMRQAHITQQMKEKWGDGLIPTHEASYSHYTGEQPVVAYKPFYMDVSETFRIVLSQDLSAQQDETINRLILKCKTVMSHLNKRYGVERVDTTYTPVDTLPYGVDPMFYVTNGVIMWMEAPVDMTAIYWARLYMISERAVGLLDT